MQIEITPDSFGGAFYLEASTLFRNEDGIDVPDIVKSLVYTNYSDLYGNGKGRFIYRADKNRYSFIFTIDKSTLILYN